MARSRSLKEMIAQQNAAQSAAPSAESPKASIPTNRPSLIGSFVKSYVTYGLQQGASSAFQKGAGELGAGGTGTQTPTAPDTRIAPNPQQLGGAQSQPTTDPLTKRRKIYY